MKPTLRGISVFAISLLWLLSFPAVVAAYTYSFTANNANPDRGKIVGPNIDCGNVCSTTYDTADTITLTAIPNPGYEVFYWGNATCVGSGNGGPANTSNTCVLDNPYAQTPFGATLYFTRTAIQVVVQKQGTGEGTVTVPQAGINCGAVCSGSVGHDAYPGVELHATAAPGSVFRGWYSDSCSGGKITGYVSTNPDCQIQLDFYDTAVLYGSPRFDKVSTSTSPTSPSNTTTPKQSAPTTAPTPGSAPVPTIAAVTVNGKTQLPNQTFVLSQDQPLTLQGTTAPNATVKLYIFSTPREATVTADAQGHWTYNIKGLEPGAHHVEAEVTDPTTHQTSSRTTLATFTLAKSSAAATRHTIQTPSSKQHSIAWLWGAIALIILSGLAYGAWQWYRHGRNWRMALQRLKWWR